MIWLNDIQPDEVSDWWPIAWPMLEPAVRITSQHDYAAVRDALLKSTFQLWLVMDGDEAVAAVVTEVSDWPAIRECSVRYCGGRRVDDWISFIAVIEEWARENGCKKIYASGRKGWIKKLPGYEEQAVVLVKDL